MAEITYTWSFHRLLTRPESPLPNTIRGVWWKLTATDGVNTAAMEGSYELPPPDDHDFILYENLTKADLILWTEREISKVWVELDERGRSTQPDGFDGNALDLYRLRLAQEIEQKAKPKPMELEVPQ